MAFYRDMSYSYPEKIIIVGASGFLGSRLFVDLSEYSKVVGTYFSRPAPDLTYLDIKNKKQVELFFEKNSPELLLICGGITRPDVCESNKEEAYQVNVNGVANLLSFCGCKVIYFSTDYVFDGRRGFYTEDDHPNPINYYGWTKYEAEKIVLEKSPDNIVIRVSGLYGYNKGNNEFIDSLLYNSAVYKANDCYSCNLLLDDIVKYLPFFWGKNGLFHLTDGVALSRYEFASKAVKILGFPTEVFPKPSEEIYCYAKRPKNSSLGSNKHSLLLHDPDSGLRHIRGTLRASNFLQNKKEAYHNG